MRKCSVANNDCSISALLFCDEPDVDSERGWFVIVADQVAHESVDDIAVERDSGHWLYRLRVEHMPVHCFVASLFLVFEVRGSHHMIRGIKFVSIPVKDQDAALSFYTEKLGFRVLTDQPFGPGQRWIELAIPGADSGLALFTPPGHEERIGGFQPISFWCEDVCATAEILKEKGVTIVKAAKKETWGTSAIFADLDGNQFVLSSR